MRSWPARTVRIARQRWVLVLLATVSMGLAPTAWALSIDSVEVDRGAQVIIIKGSGFDASLSLTLGGISQPSSNISSTLQEIPFGPALAAAIMWRGSYKLIATDVGGSVEFSVYIRAAINDPAPPPPGGSSCPCIPGWEASSIPKDNFSWCSYGTDGSQSYIIAPRDAFVISALFDPNDVFFDAANPGNSTSICALQDNGNFTVAEPLLNQDEYDDCEQWLWVNICL